MTSSNDAIARTKEHIILEQTPYHTVMVQEDEAKEGKKRKKKKRKGSTPL
jgi:hypothetical protein